jgi:hypothetical protein
VLTGNGFFMMVVAVALRRVLLTPEKLLKAIPQDSSQGPVLNLLMGRMFTLHVVLWAVNESGALMGFVLSMITQNPRHAWLLCGVAAGLNLLVHRPARATLEEAIRQLQMGRR